MTNEQKEQAMKLNEEITGLEEKLKKLMIMDNDLWTLLMKNSYSFFCDYQSVGSFSLYCSLNDKYSYFENSLS